MAPDEVRTIQRVHLDGRATHIRSNLVDAA